MMDVTSIPVLTVFLLFSSDLGCLKAKVRGRAKQVIDASAMLGDRKLVVEPISSREESIEGLYHAYIALGSV